MKHRVTGSFVALITPMNADCSIDFGGIRTLVDFHREHGTSAVLLMGSSGEVSMLSPEERHAIVAESMRARPDGMEMWFGCTGATTEATIAYVQQAAAEGADGAIVAAPSYIHASRSEIARFFLDVADAAAIPIGIYNNPPRVGTDLHTEELVTLAAHPNIVVLKESTTRVGQVAQMAASGADISLMCCCSPHLGLIVPTMALGGHGTANVTGNLIPREMAVISTPWQGPDDAARFRDAYLSALPMLEFAYSAVNPVPVKSLMGAMGMPAGPMRRPLSLLEGDALERGLEVARKLELDRVYGFRLWD
jgi:4-hydroxy-tetrahydrodipicolinate synthase